VSRTTEEERELTEGEEDTETLMVCPHATQCGENKCPARVPHGKTPLCNLFYCEVRRERAACATCAEESAPAQGTLSGCNRDGGTETTPDKKFLTGGEVRVVDPDTGGAKGQKLARFDLLPWDTLAQVATLYGVGAQKYEERNWEKGYAWGLSMAALHRHLAAFWSGENTDKETGQPHLACVIFHALALLTFATRGIGTDTRPVL